MLLPPRLRELSLRNHLFKLWHSEMSWWRILAGVLVPFLLLSPQQESSCLWLQDVFLYYGFENFLPAVSSIFYFWHSYCWMLVSQWLLRCFHLCCCPSVCLVILLPELSLPCFLCNLSADSFILVLTIFNFPGFVSCLHQLCAFQVPFPCLLICFSHLSSRLVVFLKQPMTV